MPDYITSLGRGQAVRYWHLSKLTERRFDLPDRPMQGRMDALFFVASQRNFIPHEYPCRTEFARRYRDHRPTPRTEFEPDRAWFPFGSDRVDRSGFWFRPTVVESWARTFLRSPVEREARFRLTTCGGALVFANGREAGWIASYRRNLETSTEIVVPLSKGMTEIRIWFGDLCERDARYGFTLDYMEDPPLEIRLPMAAEPDCAAAVERILEGIHFERPSYQEGEVALALPEPAPEGLEARIEITDESIAGDAVALTVPVRPGARRLVVGRAEDLPSDFRRYRVAFTKGSFSVERTLGIEICHADRLPAAPAELGDRVTQALFHVASAGERDTVGALACLALDRGGDAGPMIARCLPLIADCHDCADFLLVPLLWSRIRWPERIDPALRLQVDATILGFRYWMDEPGNDVMWWFSENHALLFHTACYLAGGLFPDREFVRSRRVGREQEVLGRDRLLSWFDHFDSCELGEWNSAPYVPIDLAGLCALQALAPDALIRQRAEKIIRRLFEIVALSSHRGVLTASQGRSYEHSLRPGRTLELSAMARLLWGHGWFGRRVHALPQLALCLRDHGLRIDPGLGAHAWWQEPVPTEWRFRQGERGIAALYHYKTRHFAMGTVAAYRAGQWGYQETVLHLRLGGRPEAQMWINHPGETIQYGHGRPSYWGGCGTLPRVHQYRSLALVDFDCNESLPDFTHIWLPEQEMDEVAHEGNRILVRAGSGLALIVGSGPLLRIGAGPSAGCEYRLPGHRGTWLIRLSDTDRDPTLGSFGQRLKDLHALRVRDGGIVIDDPDLGEVACNIGGSTAAEGRILDPGTWTMDGEAVVIGVGPLLFPTRRPS